VRVGSESDPAVEGGQWSRAFERRWRGRKEDAGVAGEEDVSGGEEKCSKVGVVRTAETRCLS